MKDTDALTGLPGRETLREALERTLGAGESVALALLDLDRFMEVNLDFGPQAGDRVLQVVAQMVQEEASAAHGSAYRVSGDEFAVVFPGATLEQAFLRMEQLRQKVAGATDRFALPEGRGMTVTIGVAQAPRDAKDAAGLLKTADSATASAKEQGRNAVGLPPNEEMVMKSCYYSADAVKKLKGLAERLGRKESVLLREALSDLIAKYDTHRAA